HLGAIPEVQLARDRRLHRAPSLGGSSARTPLHGFASDEWKWRRNPRPTERTAKSGSSPRKHATIPRTDAPLGTIANTAEPLPVIRGSSRPAARSLAHSESKSRRRRPSNA